MTCLPKHRITGMALAFDFSWSISWWKSSTFIWFFLDVTKTNKRSKLKDISIAACHIILPSLLLTKIIQEFCDLFYPLGNDFYELSILPVLLNLLLDLRTHFKASNRKNFNFFSSGRLKNVKEVKDWLHGAQQSAEDIFIWNAWAFQYWFQASLRKTNMAAEVNFFMLTWRRDSRYDLLVLLFISLVSLYAWNCMFIQDIIAYTKLWA